MSTAPAPTPRPAPSAPRARPPRTPAARRRTSPPASLPASTHRRARSGSTPAFWILTALLVTGMVVGVVSMSALQVGTSLKADALRAQMSTLSDQQGELRREVATLSAPSRVMTWARAKGMVMPENVVILRVPPAAGSEPGA